MMENDDKLLRQIFADNRLELADNGFSRRVMRSLPRRTNRLYQVWNVLCFSLAAVLFVALDGVELIIGTLREVFHSMVQSGTATQVDPKSLIVVVIVLTFLGYKKMSTLA